jgi:serine/threonine-protein kinase
MTLGEEHEPGDVVAGRYRLVSKLGTGGMASVWRAEDVSRRIDVALKFLHRGLGDRHEILARFAREAEVSSRMFSRNIVRALDRGLSSTDTPFIVYELLDGEDLATHLARVERVSLATTGEIVTQTCRALARAHGVGVVHRDIKPANLFLSYEDDHLLVKVLDFGIAKLEATRSFSIREPASGQRVKDSLPPNSLTGTLEHMSPEHVLDGNPTDARGDLWALAVVAYRCVTGRAPFPADAIGQLVVAFARGKADPPSSLVPGIPPAIDEFFIRALHREPTERFQTASEMATAAIGAFRAKTSATVAAAAPAPTGRSVPGLPATRVKS